MGNILYAVYALTVTALVAALISRREIAVKFSSFSVLSCIAVQFMLIAFKDIVEMSMSGLIDEHLTYENTRIIEFADLMIYPQIFLVGFMAVYIVWYLKKYKGFLDFSSVVKFNASIFVTAVVLERVIYYIFMLFPISSQVALSFAKIGIFVAVMLVAKTVLELVAEKLGWTDERYYSSYSSRVKEFFLAIGKKLSKVRAYAVIPLAFGGVFYQMFTRLFTYLVVVRHTEYTYVNVKMAQNYADDVKTYSIIGAVIAVILLFVWYVGRLNFTFAKEKSQLLFHVYLIGVMLIFAILAYALLWLIPPALTREGLSLQCAFQWLLGLPVLCFVMHKLFTALAEKIMYKVEK